MTIIKPDDQWATVVQTTKDAFASPQVGDRFHEMYSFWLYVVAVDGEEITVLTASPPCTLPRDGHLERYRCVHAFQEAWRDTAGYTVTLADRGNNVTGWYEAALAKAAKVYDPITGGGR